MSNLTTFKILGQKFIKFLRWFFGKTKTPKSHSEINWPLAHCFSFTNFFPVRFSQNFQLSSYVSVCTLCYRIKLLLPTTIIQTLCWQLCTRTSIDWTVNNLFMELNCKNLRWCLFDWADWFMPPVYALFLWIYVTLMRILKSCLISKFRGLQGQERHSWLVSHKNPKYPFFNFRKIKRFMRLKKWQMHNTFWE